MVLLLALTNILTPPSRTVRRTMTATMSTEQKSMVVVLSMLWMDLSKAQEEENEANEHDHGTVSPTVTFLVMVLILMTILFEKGKDAMIEAADRDTRPIIDSLFGEMTVLGFLSLFTFCLAQTGVFPQISVALFGKGEEGELLEIFEFVHYMLFSSWSSLSFVS